MMNHPLTYHGAGRITSATQRDTVGDSLQAKGQGLMGIDGLHLEDILGLHKSIIEVMCFKTSLNMLRFF